MKFCHKTEEILVYHHINIRKSINLQILNIIRLGFLKVFFFLEGQFYPPPVTFQEKLNNNLTLSKTIYLKYVEI